MGYSERVVDLGIVYQFFPHYAQEHFWREYGKISSYEHAYAKFLALYYAITLLWFGEDRKDIALIKSARNTLRYLQRK